MVISFGFLASELSVESKNSNHFAGVLHWTFFKNSNGGHQWKFSIHVVPPVIFLTKIHEAPKQNGWYFWILHSILKLNHQTKSPLTALPKTLGRNVRCALGTRATGSDIYSVFGYDGNYRGHTTTFTESIEIYFEISLLVNLLIKLNWDIVRHYCNFIEKLVLFFPFPL